MKIRTQFIITMSLFGLVVVIIALSLLVTNQRVDWLNRQQLIAQNIERGAREISYLSNDYLLYRESQQRARWESRFASFSEDVSHLNPSAPEQQVLVNNIKANQERLKAVFADVVSTLEGAAQTRDAAVDMAFIQVSWSRMEVQNQGMVFDAELLSQKFHAETDQLKQTNDLLILALIGLFGAYFIANYALIYRHTLTSISDLQEGTRIIGSGRLDFAIPEKATDEIGELARAFNRMTANLKEVTASKADLEREIAERKRAEVERERLLVEVEHRAAELDAVLDSMPDGLSIANPEGRVLRLNASAQRMLGLDATDLESSIPERLRQLAMTNSDGTPFPREESPTYRALRGETALNVIQRLHRADGALWLSVNSAPIRSPDGKQLGAVTSFTDITERKQAEERIQKLNRELEQQAEELQQINVQLEETLAEEQVAREEAEAGRNILESLMHYAPEVIFIADAPDARIRMVSQYAEVMIGHPLAQLLGVPADAHPVRRDLLQSDGVTPMAFESLPVVRAVKRGETVLDYEMILSRPDGVKRTILANAGPIRDARGNITGGIAVWRDITARKKIEQQVQKLNHDLEQRAVELQIANKELESFSYSISHDLRMPLASINGFADILLKDCGPQLPPDALTYLELIRNNSAEMNQLVEGLLSFSRSIRQPLRKQTVDLNQLVRQALEDLRAQQQGRRVEIEIGDLATCQADPVLLKQVFINLLSNALKFTRQREVAHIEIKATQTDRSEILYSVRDNGVGFDPQEADKLFGVFQRLHSQEEYEGTGVGLAIVERIIRRHGGRVCAEGEVDRGATFYFTLG